MIERSIGRHVVEEVVWGGEIIEEYPDDKYLFIENVPAEVRMKCGEKTYSPEVTDELLRFERDELKPVKTIKVPVFNFAERNQYSCCVISTQHMYLCI